MADCNCDNVIVQGNVQLTGSPSAVLKSTAAGAELVLENSNDVNGPVRLRLQNRYGVNGAIFEGTIDVFDLIFQVPSAQTQIRMEGRVAETLSGAPEFRMGVWSNPTLVVSTNGKTLLRGGNVGIGVDNPAAKLDVNGAVRVGGREVINASGQALYA